MTRIDPKKRTLADLNKEDQATIKTGAEMEGLINTPVWSFLQTVLGKHLDQKRHDMEVSSPAPGEDGLAYALRMERAKGTIIGLRLALSLPSSMIAVGKDLRKQLLGNEDDA